jgi:hypothetical protein
VVSSAFAANHVIKQTDIQTFVDTDHYLPPINSDDLRKVLDARQREALPPKKKAQTIPITEADRSERLKPRSGESRTDEPGPKTGGFQESTRPIYISVCLKLLSHGTQKIWTCIPFTSYFTALASFGTSTIKSF